MSPDLPKKKKQTRALILTVMYRCWLLSPVHSSSHCPWPMNTSACRTSEHHLSALPWCCFSLDLPPVSKLQGSGWWVSLWNTVLTVLDLEDISRLFLFFLNHSLQLPLGTGKLKTEQREKPALWCPFQQIGQSHEIYMHVNTGRWCLGYWRLYAMADHFILH